MAATHLAMLILGAVIVASAWFAGTDRPWRGFVVVLAVCVLGPPLLCLLLGVP